MPAYLDDYLGTIAPRRTRRRSSANLPFELSPEQTTSLLGRVGGVGLSGLSAAANVLDLPGSSIRDVIGGIQTGDWSRHNPFDQWIDPLGYEVADNRVEGRDLLRNAGVIGKKDTWGNFAGGLGVDILTDPLTYLGGVGLVGKLGKASKAMDLTGDIVRHGAAKAGRKVGWREASLLTSPDELVQAGKLAPDLLDDLGLTAAQRAQPMGRALRFYGPAKAIFGEGIGTGSKSQMVARGLDTAGDAIRYAPGIRHAVGAFSKAVGGATTKGGQEIMEPVVKARTKGGVDAGGEIADMLEMDSTIHDVFDLGKIRKEVDTRHNAAQATTPGWKPLSSKDLDIESNKAYTQRSNDILRFLENTGDSTAQRTLPPELEQYRPQLEKWRELEQGMVPWERDVAGIDSPQLGDVFIEHVTRIPHRFADTSYFGTKGAVTATHPYQNKRMDFLKNLRDGTALIQDLSVDPEFSGIAHKYAKHIARKGMTEAKILDEAIEGLEEGAFVTTPKVAKDELDNLVKKFQDKYGDRAQLTVGPQETMIGPSEENIRELVHWATTLDPRHAQKQIPFFERNPLIGLEKRLEAGRAVGNTNIEFMKQLAARTVPKSEIEREAGRGLPIADVVAKMHGKENIKDVNPQTKAMLAEHLAGNPGAQAARAAGAKASADTAAQAGVQADIVRDDILTKLTEQFDGLNPRVDETIADLKRKQSVVKRFEVADQMTETLDSLIADLADADKAHLAMQSLDDIISAAEEVGPLAVEKAVLQEFKDQVAKLRGPLDALDAKLKRKRNVDKIDAIKKEFNDKATKLQIRELALREAKGGPASAGEAAENANKARDAAKLTDEYEKAIIDAGDDEGLKHNALIAYESQLNALKRVPIERKVSVTPSITETLEKALRRVKSQVRRELKASTIGNARQTLSKLGEEIATKGSSLHSRAAIKASNKFGQAATEETADDFLSAMRDAIDGEATNAGSLADLDLDKIQQAFQEGIGQTRESARKLVHGAAEASKPVPTDGLDEMLEKMYLPEDVANDVIGIMQGITNPKKLGLFMQIMDRVLSHWRAGVTAAPAFHGRNHVSSNMQSALADAWDPKSYAQGWLISRGRKKIDGLADSIPEYKRLGLTDEQAMVRLRKEIYQHQVNSLRHGQHVSEGQKRARRFAGETPFFEPVAPGVTPLQRANPLSVETFEPFRISGGIGDAVEQQARITPYLNLRKKGWTPEAAAKRVLEIQVDYRGGAPMDATMRRVFPFWSFTKGATSFLVNELVDRPGGRMSKTLRGINRMGGSDETTPDYIRETASIPIGELPDGSKRYLTGFGMMAEDPLSFGGAGVRGALLEGASRMNPFIKGPMEWMSGQTFFQKGVAGGRPLEDLDPTVGRTIANIKELMGGEQTKYAKPAMGSDTLEFILGNSPASRLLTSARTASDSRKGAGGKAMNLLTGFKVSDVSPASQDAILQEAANAAMKRLGGKTFPISYIPVEERAKLSPKEQLDAALIDALMKELDRRKKERKKAG